MSKGKKPKSRKRAKPALSRETLKNLTPGRAARVQGGVASVGDYCSDWCPKRPKAPAPAPGPSPVPVPTPTPTPG